VNTGIAADELPEGDGVIACHHLGGLFADMIEEALVLPLTTLGITPASTIRRPANDHRLAIVAEIDGDLKLAGYVFVEH
jgi:hypothetical protein